MVLQTTFYMRLKNSLLVAELTCSVIISLYASYNLSNTQIAMTRPILDLKNSFNY